MKTIQLMNHRFATFLVAFVLLFASCDNPIFDPGGEGNGGGNVFCSPADGLVCTAGSPCGRIRSYFLKEK